MLAAPAVLALPWMAQAPLQATGTLNETCCRWRQLCAETSKQTICCMVEQKQHDLGGNLVRSHGACNHIKSTPGKGSQCDQPGVAAVEGSRLFDDPRGGWG